MQGYAVLEPVRRAETHRPTMPVVESGAGRPRHHRRRAGRDGLDRPRRAVDRRAGRRALGAHPRGVVADRRSSCSTPTAGAETEAPVRRGQIGPNRAGSSAGGATDRRPVIRSANRAAEPGPVEIPHGPWPARTHSPSIPGTRPTSGRPSALSGRAQTRARSHGPASRSPARIAPHGRRAAAPTRPDRARRRCRGTSSRASWTGRPGRG